MIKIDNLPEARENNSFQVGVGFGLAFDWLRRWRKFFLDQSLNQNQSNPGSRSLLNWILLYSKEVLFLSYLQNTPDFYM